MMIVRYDEENLRFSLMNSNQTTRDELGIKDDISFNRIIRILRVDLR